jgi:hypothetical protein
MLVAIDFAAVLVLLLVDLRRGGHHRERRCTIIVPMSFMFRFLRCDPGVFESLTMD